MKPTQLFPPIEKRLSAWIEIQDKKKAEQCVSAPVTITVSREFGCEGYPLAAALKKELETKTDCDWTVFDDDLVEMMQAEQSATRYLTKSYGERSKFMDDLIDMISPSWKSEEDVFRPMVKTIHQIAAKGHAIIVGRGAFAITQDLPNCFHIRLKAPLSFRAKVMTKYLDVSEDEALIMVQEKEEQRTVFLESLLNTKFTMDHFHAIFDNSKASVEDIAKTFVEFIGRIQ